MSRLRRSRAVALAAALVTAAAGGAGPASAGPGGDPPCAFTTTGCVQGNWLVAADGGVFALGDTPLGSTGAIRLNRPIVGIAAIPAGTGYWLVASDGGVFSFGDARFAGSTGALRLNAPIVAMAPSPTGAGYWLVATDGGIFAFGDARFYGSLGAAPLNRPIVGMATSPNGYWLVASDGGVFAFGDARFLGSTGGRILAAPVVGLAASGPDGYRLATTGRQVFAFGTARILPPAIGNVRGGSIAAIIERGGSYELVGADGRVSGFGDTANRRPTAPLRLNRPIVGAAAPPDSPGDSILPGAYIERTDQTATVRFKGGVAEAAGAGISDCFCRDRLYFSTAIRAAQGATAAFDVQLLNTTGVPIEFPGGLHFEVRRDGQLFRTVTVGPPLIGALAPGASVNATVALSQAPDGVYDIGSITILIR